MGCIWTKQQIKYEDPSILAAQTCFKENEVKALFELFRKLSSSLGDDGYISKEEFQLGLFRNRNEQSLFADRIFQLFDTNHDGFIEFGEFVRSLSIFHPEAPHSEKVAFAFHLYDIWQTGFIEPEEVKLLIILPSRKFKIFWSNFYMDNHVRRLGQLLTFLVKGEGDDSGSSK